MSVLCATAGHMLLDYDISHSTRRCAGSQRPLAPGEEFYSTLQIEGGSPIRRDFAAEAWTGPPDGILAWWKSRMDAAAKAQLAPQEALVNLFAALADQPNEAEFRYVLGLLLLRRKWLKVVDSEHGRRDGWLLVECPQREEQFEFLVAAPDAAAAAELETRLTHLLYGGADGA